MNNILLNKSNIYYNYIIKSSELGKKLSSVFFIKLNAMCERLSIKPEDILVLMYLETRFDPNAGKPGRAAGLNQILPQYLKNFGFNGSADDLRAMKGEDQLPYIENYFNKIKQTIGRPIRNAGDLYMANLWPAGLNYPGVRKNILSTPIITPKNGKAFSQNAPQMDFDKDGIITYGDFIKLTENVKQRPEFKQVYNRFRSAIGEQPSSHKHSRNPSSNNILVSFFKKIEDLLDNLTKSAGDNLKKNQYRIVVSSDEDLSSKLEFSRILSLGLKEELDIKSKILLNNNDIELQCDFDSDKENVLMELCAAFADVFEDATKKIGGVKIYAAVYPNELSDYQELDIKIAEINYRKFHLKFAKKGI